MFIKPLSHIYVKPKFISPWDHHIGGRQDPPMHTGGYIFVSSCMRRRPPLKNPIKGRVLPSKVSQSLGLESSTSQNFSCDQPLDYAVALSPA